VDKAPDAWEVVIDASPDLSVRRSLIRRKGTQSKRDDVHSLQGSTAISGRGIMAGKACFGNNTAIFIALETFPSQFFLPSNGGLEVEAE
jgi:hypothetical protein